MKKSLLILAAASTVAFAACNGGNNEGKLTPAQADSIATVKVDSAKAALKASNDSAMNAKANADAKTADSIRVIDSIVAATKQTMTTKTVVTRKPSSHGHSGGSTTTTTTTVQPAPPETVGNGKPKMTGQNTQNGDNGNGTIGNGKPKM
jgi:hypothetical protein